MTSSTRKQSSKRRRGRLLCRQFTHKAHALLGFAVAISAISFATAGTAEAFQSHEASPFFYFESSTHQRLTTLQLSNFDSLSGAVVDLLAYVRAHIDPEPRDQLMARIPAYNRRQHFGGWINSDPERNCLDTRSEVLVRDAVPGAELTYQKGTCMVVSGRWFDPYTATEFKMAHAVQIDHVVPLKNAYLAGAWTWDFARRCHYANYLGNRFHLLAVSGHENMTKSDRGPDRYMPPDETYHCTYLQQWLKIKAIWGLNVTPAEEEAVERILTERHCPLDTSAISVAELAIEAEKSRTPNLKCIELGSHQPPPTPPPDALTSP